MQLNPVLQSQCAMVRISTHLVPVIGLDTSALTSCTHASPGMLLGASFVAETNKSLLSAIACALLSVGHLLI